MQVRKQLPQSVLVAVVAIAVAAPVAGAVPMYDGHPPAAQGDVYDVDRVTGAYVPAGATQDMHASTVATGDDTSTPADLRTEGAKSPIESDVKVDATVPAGSDLRTEAAKGPGAGSPPLGLPTFPTNTQPLDPPRSTPVVVATDGGDDPVDWPLAGFIAAGAIALAGAAAIGARQVRHARPAR
jgi:hypothetical protein